MSPTFLGACALRRPLQAACTDSPLAAKPCRWCVESRPRVFRRAAQTLPTVECRRIVQLRQMHANPCNRWATQKTCRKVQLVQYSAKTPRVNRLFARQRDLHKRQACIDVQNHQPSEGARCPSAHPSAPNSAPAPMTRPPFGAAHLSAPNGAPNTNATPAVWRSSSIPPNTPSSRLLLYSPHITRSLLYRPITV